MKTIKIYKDGHGGCKEAEITLEEAWGFYETYSERVEDIDNAISLSDSYGGTARITKTDDSSYRLESWTSHGRKIRDTKHKTLRGAKAAYSRDADGMVKDNSGVVL